jgi:hypothetical protein
VKFPAGSMDRGEAGGREARLSLWRAARRPSGKALSGVYGMREMRRFRIGRCYSWTRGVRLAAKGVRDALVSMAANCKISAPRL